MTITSAGLKGSTGYASATTGTRDCGTLSTGQLLVVTVGRYSASNDPIDAGDISKTAGTATLGAFALDIQNSSSEAHAGIFSAIVTAGGTCTVTVAGHPSGSYFDIGSEAFNGSWDSSRLEDTSTNQSASTTAVSTLDATSAGAALFVGAFNDTSGATSYTVDGAFTDIYKDNGSPNNSAAAYRIVSTGATDAAEWTANTAIWHAAALAVYKEAAGGSTQAPIAHHHLRQMRG